MENHPIPQDVTGFQFKLIGNMTIKQFAYVATGAVLAWLFYSSPIALFVKLPMILLFASLGFSLAFVPLEGRPMDTMILYFIKSLFTPNQYVFQKHDGFFQVSTPIPQHNKPVEPPSQPEPKLPPPIAISEKGGEEKLPEPEPKPEPQPVLVQEKIVQEQTVEQRDVIKQLQEVISQKGQLEKELAMLKASLAAQQQVTTSTPVIPKAEAPSIKKVAKSTPVKTTGIPTPDVPNLLVGIIKDPRGNSLPNILVEVKDSNGNPIRAFKTNDLGQFASATPLLNGVYTIEVDDPRKQHTFDTIELTVKGTIIGPVEITSKDQREELRKALFPSHAS